MSAFRSFQDRCHARPKAEPRGEQVPLPRFRQMGLTGFNNHDVLYKPPGGGLIRYRLVNSFFFFVFCFGVCFFFGCLVFLGVLGVLGFWGLGGFGRFGFFSGFGFFLGFFFWLEV